MTERFSELTLSNTLAETVRASAALRHLLLETITSKHAWSTSGLSVHLVQHSFTDGTLDNRESDILCAFRTAEPRLHWVLVEVKINAPFGTNQADDYCKRREKAVADKRCDACATVVVAPSKYLEFHQRDVTKFDAALSLEMIREAIADEKGLAETLLVNHIDAALRLFAVGYTPLHDKLREGQIEWYHTFVKGYKPHLVPNATTAGKQVRDIFYPVPGQRIGYITHRVFAGEVSVGFMNRGHKLNEVERRLMQLGDQTVRAEFRPKTSLYFAAISHVPAIDEGRGFAEQESTVQRGIDVVDQIHLWSVENAALLADVVR